MDDIIVKPICPTKTCDVIQHLRNNFFADEPLNKSVGLVKRGDPHEDLEEYSLNTINQGLSYMAIFCITGEVIGVALNGFETEEKPPQKIFSDRKIQKIFDFLGNAGKDVKYLKKFDPASIFQMRILSVDQKFRGRGIGRKLVDVTEQLARSRGFSLIQAEATALFSQKLLENRGFNTIKEIIYEEYPTKDAPQFKVEYPHTLFKLMVKELKGCIC